MLSSLLYAKAIVEVETVSSESHIEVTIDLEPIMAEIEDFSPTSEVYATDREALTAKFERIRAECFQHPVSQALMEQIGNQVQQVITRTIEEALIEEVKGHLGPYLAVQDKWFERYERTRAAKLAHQHRSPMGAGKVRIPKLRKGNKKRTWQVLERYERNFGPWLDLQLHLYRLGLSQYDLQEILHLGFGQVLSLKAVQHLTDVAQREMETFRQTPLDDTPSALVVDGVNIKVLLPSRMYSTNQRGQRRQVKYREDRVILAALGVWPDGDYQIIDFEMVEKETKTSWKKLFRNLLSKDLDKSLLQLIVSDGRPGLHTAIRSVFPKTVKHQRCIFHKLKNLGDNLTYKNLEMDPNLSRREARKQAKKARARAILRDAAHIYSGRDTKTIRQRMTDFRRKWWYVSMTLTQLGH
ncbi:MAG: hypothetical protein GY832_10110 [Chloroflexi bacterium]|nr:hypothetical protein [Chloroflexota bacterium]